MEEKTTAQGEGPWAGDEEAQDQGNYSGQKWINANKSNPCFHCGGTDRCSILYDGSWCNCRNPSANDTEPTGGEVGVDAYWAHPYNADGPSDRGTVPPGPPCASLQDRHKVYDALLALLSLSGAHGKALRARGFTDGQIKKRGYRTMPGKDRVTVAEKLVAQFGEDLIRKVPGFYWRPVEKDWSMAGMAGILVPALTIHGSINALRIRLDKPDASGKRYHWLSSSTHGGPGVTACVHVPLSCPLDIRTVRITEGEFKADLATDLSGVTTLSVPGVRCWEKALALLPRLASGTLHKVKTIRVAFDADAEHKLDVAHALKQLITDKRTQKYAVELETWEEIQPDGRETKGIDDLLAAGLQPTVLTGEAVLEEVERILASAKAGQEEKPGQEEGEGDPEIISFGLGIDELDLIPDREDLIEGIWAARCLTAIIGPPSGGKTLVALDLSMSIITETPWHGQAVNVELCGDVVWIAGEQEENLKNLIKGWTTENPDRLPKHQIHIFRHAVPLRNATERAKLIAKIKKKIGNRKVVAIIADTLQANFGEGDVDNNNDMREFVVNGMADLRKSFDDALVCAPHHTGWDRYREKNASALRDNVLTMWHITMANEKAPAQVQVPIELRCSKPKGGEMNPRQFIIEKKRGVKETATGQQAWTYAVLRPLEANDVDHDQKWIGPFLRKGAQQTMDVIAAKYPKAMTRKEIEAATARATTTTREYLVELIAKEAIEAVGENPDVSYRLTGNGRKWHPKTRLEWEFQRVTADLKAEGIQ